MRRGAGIGAVAVACAALALAGCGGGGEEGDPTVVLEHLPGRGPTFAYVDLAAGRDQLGLPEAWSPSDPADSDSTDSIALALAAGRPMPWLSGPRPGKGVDALDGGAVISAAGNGTTGGPGISVVLTDQPFDEISTALEDQGYRGEGDYLERPGPLRDTRDLPPVVADAGDGIVVLGFEPAQVERAVDGEGGLARELLDRVDGADRQAVAPDSRCIRGLAAGESFDPRSGELWMEVEGKFSTNRSNLPRFVSIGGAEMKAVTVEGGVLTAKLAPDPGASSLGGFNPTLIVGSGITDHGDPVAMYDC